MTRTIRPASGIAGSISLPGDKSISHRYAMLAALAEGRSVLTNFSSGQDCASTLYCIRALGARCGVQGDRVEIVGPGLGQLHAPSEALDAGNSGTTMRLLSGILAGQDFECQIKGDASLSQRPMKRILTPLRAMGASIDARDGKYPPLRIRGGTLRPIRYELPVASAQVKSAVLLAGLRAPGRTQVVEPLETRNHSEIALRRFGADVTVEDSDDLDHGNATADGLRPAYSQRPVLRSLLPGRRIAAAGIRPAYPRSRAQPYSHGRALGAAVDGSLDRDPSGTERHGRALRHAGSPRRARHPRRRDQWRLHRRRDRRDSDPVSARGGV